MNQARAPRGGEEGIAPEVQGRHRQPGDDGHTEEAQAQQVCGFLIGLREHDREFIAHAGDDPDDARDRGEKREESKDLRAGHWNTLFSGGSGLTRHPFWCEGLRAIGEEER